ncbi:cyclic peptide export ABC transporter [Pendulispora rubella]|uniref:Cyclic peptide export ABC transporter n=1 Tax=Pendulispora rubella TaxID=2741070 RepID=A0ABZ2L459_9BACT
MPSHDEPSHPPPPEATLAREILRLLRPFRVLAAFSSVTGVLSGLGMAWLIATLNASLHAEKGKLGSILLAFAALCLLVLAGETLAAVGNSFVGQRVIANLRKEVVARIVCAPIPAIQKYRAPRLLSTLGHDVDTISAFSFNASGLLVAVAITLGCLTYLAFLSPGLFVVALVAIAVGLAGNLVAGRIWMKAYAGVRDAQDDLQKGYVAITEGAKELRMNRRRRARVHGVQLRGSVDRIRDLKMTAMRAFWASRAFSAMLFFAGIGAIVALGDHYTVDAGTVSGFALVLLYIKGPIEQVVIQLPSVGQAQISLKRVAELSAAFQTPELSLADTTDTAPARDALQSIELRGARYRFPAAQGSSTFELGPVDLTIQQGETLFITGENGCGKTTLLMVLLGLYEPTGGELLLDGASVEPRARDAYRQLFSPVFFDYLLFQDLITRADSDADLARDYLERLEIAHKVTIEDGAFSTIDLSAGQRKRLALVQAYLENRPILVFDEWAAEQDPTFRRVFYTEILPDLKRQGKTLVVISHDDRYFHVADRRVTLRSGRIVEDVRPALPWAGVGS